MRTSVCIYIIVYFLSQNIDCLTYTNVINLPQGKLRGVQILNGEYQKYLGIPYAELVGRFENPGSPPSWDGTLDANKIIRCNQYVNRLNFPAGHEDCLSLNIFAPISNGSRAYLPVMVYIHGGSFDHDDGYLLNYDPEPLVRKGVIVVTINYRIGAFGFLCLRIREAPGNVGLKDQVAALRWVNYYIKYFGGDSKSVTLFGEGAGSSSISYLMLCTACKGLFSRAIMQSGSVFSPFAITPDPINVAAIVASKLGYSTKNPYDLLKIYLNASAYDIIIASLPDSNMNPLKLNNFRPCIERETIDTKPFITTSTKEILKSGNYIKVPTIIGYNDKEGIDFIAKFDKKELNAFYRNFDRVLPDNLYFKNRVEKTTIANDIKTFYFKNKYNFNNSVDNFIDYFSDIFYHYPSVAITESLLENENMNLFNYYFKYDSNRNLAKYVTGIKNQKGASHSDELSYLFQPMFQWPQPKSKRDLLMADLLTSVWTDFAKTGDTDNSLRKWIASTNGNLRFMVFDQATRISPIPNLRRMEFWKYIYNKFGDSN